MGKEKTSSRALPMHLSSDVLAELCSMVERFSS